MPQISVSLIFMSARWRRYAIGGKHLNFLSQWVPLTFAVATAPSPVQSTSLQGYHESLKLSNDLESFYKKSCGINASKCLSIGYKWPRHRVIDIRTPRSRAGKQCLTASRAGSFTVLLCVHTQNINITEKLVPCLSWQWKLFISSFLKSEYRRYRKMQVTHEFAAPPVNEGLAKWSNRWLSAPLTSEYWDKISCWSFRCQEIVNQFHSAARACIWSSSRD